MVRMNPERSEAMSNATHDCQRPQEIREYSIIDTMCAIEHWLLSASFLFLCIRFISFVGHVLLKVSWRPDNTHAGEV